MAKQNIRIDFECKTNKDYVMVNTATFHLRDGGTISLDRDRTIYSITDGKLSMTWEGIYLWRVNGENIFSNTNVFPSETLISLLDGSWVELELEDDADEDYVISDISWTVGDGVRHACGNDNAPRKTNFLLITTDGYNLDDFAFYETFAEAQNSMQEAYERCVPKEWIESYRELSSCNERDAILYNNGDDVFVWRIIKMPD